MKKWRDNTIPKRISEGYYGYCEICKSPNKEGTSSRKFCSTKCKGIAKSNNFPERNRKCKQCGKEFTTNPSYLKRRENAGIFCNRECWKKSVSASPGWIDKQGYRCIHRNGRRIREHRFVVEQDLGRVLEPTEHIHHIDGNKLNNELNNLYLTNNSEHRLIHVGMEKLVYKMLADGLLGFKKGIYKIK